MAIRVGDTVGYSRAFLKGIKMPATDPIWRAIGTVTDIKGYNPISVAYVRWTEPLDSPQTGTISHIGTHSLARVGAVSYID